ncbi:hypothetical protein NDU88_006914 [Pleurodeles waltl]|uniref:Uncharacterized protein n=1 Tax=Pleurodeles waltl TaxID=8319 RepID=A0AAV7PK41_PLEWA|nr:hypothetical protein NDU88_006914 [Pleurodeles waltl]
MEAGMIIFPVVLALVLQSMVLGGRQQPKRLLPMLNNIAVECRGVLWSCSRQLAAPATTREKSGTESRFPHPCNERAGIGSPGGRTPEPLRGCQDNADAPTGDPDVRVPEIIKTDEGLLGKEVPNKEDAGGGEGIDEDGNTGDDERTRTTNPKTHSVKNTTTKEEATESREFRHVPGGTWLHQTDKRWSNPDIIMLLAVPQFKIEQEEPVEADFRRLNGPIRAILHSAEMAGPSSVRAASTPAWAITNGSTQGLSGDEGHEKGQRTRLVGKSIPVKWAMVDLCVPWCHCLLIYYPVRFTWVNVMPRCCQSSGLGERGSCTPTLASLKMRLLLTLSPTL